MRPFLQYWKRRTRVVLGIAGGTGIVLVGLIDYFTGSEVSFSIFYLVPIGLVTLFVGRRAGLVMAFISSAVWLGAELAWADTVFHPLIPFWNAVMRLGIFLIIVFLTSGLNTLNERLEERVDERTEALKAEITERKLLEERLLHARKMEAIGTLSGGLAHDFNNILAGIIGYASLAKDSVEPGHPLARNMERIEKLSQRGADITKALLAFARKGTYQFKPLNITGVIESVLQVIRETRGAGIRIVSEMPEEIMSIRGDEGQLHQVVMNLCLNACEAMPEGGELTVKAGKVKTDDAFFRDHPDRRGRPFIFISVSDTGTGMDHEVQGRIFEPFFTTKKARLGAGLGLAMVIGIVEGHGGTISVKSTPSQGSTFTAYFPATGETVAEESGKIVEVLSGDETILLVDDEEDFRITARERLRQLGYQVFEAAAGEEALMVLKEKKGKVDLVLLDMVMKGMGGAATFRKLREVIPDLPIIICTGYSIDSSCQKILQEGAEGFIQKPFDNAKLASEIRQVLDRRPRRS